MNTRGAFARYDEDPSMHHERFPLRVSSIVLALAAGSAQEPPGRAGPEGQEPARSAPDVLGADPIQEITTLFQRVERKLAAIDLELARAGAGEAPIERLAEAGIEELLRGARNASDAVVRDIDRILEVAKQLNGQGQGAGT
jgi:hypothetical protein